MSKFDLQYTPDATDEDELATFDIEARRPNGNPYEQASTVLPQMFIERALPKDLLR